VTEVNVALGRALEFTKRIEDRCATVREPFEWGTFLSYPELPLVWALNFARVETDAVPDAAALVDAVQALPWPDASRHRKIVVQDERLGRRLAPGFVDLEWQVERLVFMALTGAAPPPPPIPVREMSSDERAEASVRFLPQIGTKVDDALHQIIASRRVVEGAVDVFRFGAFEDGEVACMCELFLEAGTAQIEDVATAERFRKRGLATAVVLTAVDSARAAGADFVFLIADAEDWPKTMYSKLGFEEIGITYEFTLPPDET
jgi:ribosomal protein S18 acetylase RimI-like enzyme